MTDFEKFENSIIGFREEIDKLIKKGENKEMMIKVSVENYKNEDNEKLEPSVRAGFKMAAELAIYRIKYGELEELK